MKRTCLSSSPPPVAISLWNVCKPDFLGERSDYFYPWGVLAFTCLIAGFSVSLWLAPPKWANLPACLFLAGAISNFAVMAANHGFMPVIDPWFHHAHGCWRAAVPTDHLLFLCDRIRLVGQHTLMWWFAAVLLPDSLFRTRFADFLMAGALVLSVGDFLIFGSIPLSVFWPNLIGKKWGPGETARLTLKSIGIVALMLGFSLVTNHEHALDPESFIFFLACFFIAGSCFAGSKALRQRARKLEMLAALKAR